jgi:hypothetical protein
MPAPAAAVIADPNLDRDAALCGAAAQADPLQLLRQQLLDMRRTIVKTLAVEFDGGDMALLATVHHALAGVEAEIKARE